MKRRRVIYLNANCAIRSRKMLRLSFLTTIVIVCVQAVAAKADVNCLAQGEACYHGCPPTTLTGPAYPHCWQDCDKQTSACIDQRAKQVTEDAAARQCLSIPTDRKAFSNQLDAAVQRKKASLQESQATLVKIRQDLESDYAWTIGDPGSMREMVTMLALCTKTTADLIEDLGGLSIEKGGGVAKEVYESIEDGKNVYDLTVKDAGQAAIEVMLDAGAHLNPTVKAAKALNDFAENAKSMSDLQSSLDDSRNEFKRRLNDLNSQIDVLDIQLNRIEASSEEPKAESLFQTYQAVRQTCAEANPKR